MDDSLEEAKKSQDSTTSDSTTKKTQMFIFTPEKLQQLGIGNILQKITGKTLDIVEHKDNSANVELENVKNELKTATDVSEENKTEDSLNIKGNTEESISKELDNTEIKQTKSTENITEEVNILEQKIGDDISKTPENEISEQRISDLENDKLQIIQNKISEQETTDKPSETSENINSQSEQENCSEENINVKKELVIEENISEESNTLIMENEVIYFKIEDPDAEVNDSKLIDRLIDLDFPAQQKKAQINIISNELIKSPTRSESPPGDTKSIIASNLGKILLCKKIDYLPENSSRNMNLGKCMKNRLSQILSPDKKFLANVLKLENIENNLPSTSGKGTQDIKKKLKELDNEEKKHETKIAEKDPLSEVIKEENNISVAKIEPKFDFEHAEENRLIIDKPPTQLEKKNDKSSDVEEHSSQNQSSSSEHKEKIVDTQSEQNIEENEPENILSADNTKLDSPPHKAEKTQSSSEKAVKSKEKSQVLKHVEDIEKLISKPSSSKDKNNTQPKFHTLKSSDGGFKFNFGSTGRLSSMSSKDLSLKSSKTDSKLPKESAKLNKKTEEQKLLDFAAIEQAMEEMHKETEDETVVKIKTETVEEDKIKEQKDIKSANIQRSNSWQNSSTENIKAELKNIPPIKKQIIAKLDEERNASGSKPKTITEEVRTPKEIIKQKTPSSESQKTPLSESQKTNSEDVSKSTNIKKRGRKPGSSTKQPTPKIEDEYFESLSTPIRKSSRARKSKNLGNDFITDESFMDSPDEEDDEDDVNIKEEREEIIFAPEKKKRGRPKKKDVFAVTNEEVQAMKEKILQNISRNKEKVSEKIEKERESLTEDKTEDTKNIETVEDTIDTNQKDKEEHIIVPKKRGRPRKSHERNELKIQKKPRVEENIHSDTDEEEQTSKKRLLEEDEPSTSKKSKLEESEESDSDSYEEIEKTPRKKGKISKDGSNTVKCDSCKEDLPKQKWVYHNQRCHNNLSWREGDEPLDLNDQKLVMNILQGVIKAKRPLRCELCGTTKKSVVGYLSHKAICQKTEEEIQAMRVTCEICQKTYHPSSLPSHMYQNHGEKKIQHKKIQEKTLDTLPTEGRTKRKAAEKAINILQNVTKEDEEEVIKTDQPLSVPKILYRRPDNPNTSVIGGSLLKRLKKELANSGSVSCKFKDCKYKCTTTDEIKKHLSICPVKEDDDYICRICLYITKDENDIKNHCIEIHMKQKIKGVRKDEDDDDDDEEEIEVSESEEDVWSDDPSEKEMEKKPRTQTYARTRCTIGFLRKERSCSATQLCIYPAAYKWTFDFCKNNYQNLLFTENFHTKSDWIQIPKDEVDTYLPKEKISMHCESVMIENKIINVQGTERKWKQFNLFESEINRDTAILYCGGPIFALSWIPTLHDKEHNQYLAVSALNNHGKKYKVSENCSSTEVLQFWKFGPITNNEVLKEVPKLAFGLVHEHGNVWAMDWCPSGCFNEDSSEDKLGRIGMVALACSDGIIPVYTISIVEQLKETENSEVKLYRTKPTYKLIQCEKTDKEFGDWNYQTTKVAWSKVKGHDIIAGGYSNGIVALWNLSSKSPLLRKQEDGVTILKPYQIFQAHEGSISALCLNVNEDGKKWLFTGSMDRSSKYWDLENTKYPLSIHNKSIVTDGYWLNHWMSTFCAYDDVFSYSHTCATVQSLRDYSFAQFPAIASNSTITTLSGCDWANQVAQGNYAGELVAMFPHQLLVTCDSDKTMKSKRMMLSYTELVEKDLPPEEREKKMKEKQGFLDELSKDVGEKDEFSVIKELMKKEKMPFEPEETTYEDATKKYGLVFHCFKLDSHKMVTEAQNWLRQASNMHKAYIELYPLNSINRVCWNPNKQGFLYVAAGYNAGFVTVQNVRFMRSVS